LAQDVIEYEFRVRIPLKSLVTSLMAGFLLILSVLIVILTSQRREKEMKHGLDVHRVARVHLVEQFFPKCFLNCTVGEVEFDHQSLSSFQIIGMTLRQQTSNGDMVVTLPPATVSSTEPLHVE
jgi:hypothetical protein